MQNYFTTKINIRKAKSQIACIRDGFKENFSR